MDTYWDKINDLIGQLSKEATDALHGASAPKSVKKGGHLLRQGKICRYSYFIVKGIARKYYLTDGKDITTEFYFTGDLAMSLCSYSLQQPSREYIQAVTDVEAIQTDYDVFQRAKHRYPELHAFDVKITELYAMWLEERLFQFYTQSATDRYVQLLKSYPNIIQYIPLTHIASYLGVALETLSRVRARI